MKKVFLFSSLLISFIFFFGSCRKTSINNYQVDVITSPVYNLQPIRSGSSEIVTSYRISNYGECITVNSVVLHVSNPNGIIGSVSYRLINSNIWNSMSVINGDNYIILTLNQGLESGQSGIDFNIKINTNIFTGSGTGIVEIQSINTDHGVFVPATQSWIQFPLQS